MPEDRSRRPPNRTIGALAIAVLVFVGLGAWWILRSKDDELAIPHASGATAAAEDRAAAPVETNSSHEPTVAPERHAEPAPVAAVDFSSIPAPESYTRELSGLRGRLVEADGKPIGDLKVELIRLHPDVLTLAMESGFAPAPKEVVELAVDTASSDAEGRFVLRNAQSGSLSMLGIDLGGPRGTVRMLDVSFERGKTCDLGDIVLPPHVTFTGTVLDEEGAPIAGARVRVLPQLPWPIPTQVLDVGVEDIRSDCAALVLSPAPPLSAKLVTEAPPWLRAAMDRLPLPTTRSEGDGRFRLAGIPAGLVTVLVDHAGHLGIVKAGVPTGRREEQDIGKLRLSSGRTVTGRVVAGKTPVSGARLFVGTTVPFPIDEGTSVAVGQPAGVSDEKGAFSISGLPLNGNVLCAVQPQPGDPWSLLGPFEKDEVELALPPTGLLTVHVLGPEGKPIDGAQLRFLEATPFNEVPILSAPRELRGRVRADPEGTYVVSGLPLGPWSVLARAPGFGISTARVELPAEGIATQIQLAPARSMKVHVVAAADGSAVEHALVAALADQQNFFPMPFAVTRSDANGDATLGSLPAGKGLVIRVTHPGFAPMISAIAPDAAPTGELPPLSMALLRGGDLVGRVLTAGEPPPKPVMLVLEPHFSSGNREIVDLQVPRFGITNADGTFRIPHLPAGDWGYELFSRFFATDPLSLLHSAIEEPEPLAKGDFKIDEGHETRLDVEAAPEGDGTPASLHGRIRVDGAVAEGVEVQLFARRHRQTDVDASGNYHLDELRAGQYTLEVRQKRGDSVATLHRAQVVLAAGESKQLDVDVTTIEVEILVHSADGKAVEGVTLNASKLDRDQGMASTGTESSANSDAEGRARLPLTAGSWRLTAYENDHGRASLNFEVDEHGSHSFDVVLDPGVVCSGRLEFDGAPPTSDQWYLMLQRTGSNDFGGDEGSWSQVSAADRNFKFRLVVPGRYHVQLFADGTGGNCQSEEFEVGPHGATDLVIRLRTQ